MDGQNVPATADEGRSSTRPSGQQAQVISDTSHSNGGDVLAAALRYASRGFEVFPCASGPALDKAKKPLTKHGFKDATTDPAQIREWWRKWPDALIGCATGKSFWVLDLDTKNDKDGLAAFKLLMQVFGASGKGHAASRTPSGGVHLFFSNCDSIRSTASKIVPGIDVRATGGYVILPPSELYNGGMYAWNHEEDPQEAASWVLDLAHGHRAFLFQAVLEVANAPEGTRNNTLFKAACEIGRHVAGGSISAEVAHDLLERAAEIASAAGEPLSSNEIRETIERGFRAGEKEPKHNSNRILDEMNEKYCVVDVEGKAFVVTFKEDALGRLAPTYYSFDQFKNLHDHLKIDGRGKGSWWLRHKGRRQYEGVTLRPGTKGAIEDTPGLLNLWRGFGVQPKPGDWPLLKRHITEVLADGNMDHAEYIARWLAWSVQNPGQRAEVALVFKSDEEDAGKGTLGNTMTRIFGPHGLRVDRHEHLTGKFNAHLQSASFLFADEAFWPGEKSVEGVLKGLITEPTRMIEPKGVNPFEVPNCLHLMIASNNKWTVPAGPTARRFAVFRVSPHRVGDRAWFKAIFDQLDSGGREAMLDDLLNMDLGQWHPRDDVPRTGELLVEKINTLSPEQKWWMGVISSGELPSYPPLEANQCVTTYLYEAYITHAGKTGARFRSIEVQIGKFLKEVVPGLRKSQQTYREKGRDRRGNVYTFPPLADCRRAFDGVLQQRWEWEEPGEWLERSEEGESAGDEQHVPF